MTHDVRGSADRYRDLFRRHPSEIEHLDDLGQRMILELEGLECLVKVQKLHFAVGALVVYLDVRVPWNTGVASAALFRAERARGRPAPAA
jgi:hypothetical protein